jgi:serine protease Do
MRNARWRAAALVAALAVVVGSGAGTEARAQHSRKTPIVEAIEKTRSSVVSVSVPRTGRKDAVGTGVIVDENGVIVTNGHVVGGAKAVNVRLADGKELPARVLGTDPQVDLAVLRVDAGAVLPALTLAPAGDIMVGERVIAVGHPFGYVNTVSTGIVSALNREITMPTGAVLTGLIQTDASINPGNSGGPLLNINGELIGINVALRDGANGIAFAINADTVKLMLSRYLSARRMGGIYHGLSCSEKILGETGPRQRVVIAAVDENAPAAGAGLQRGDEILTVANRTVANRFDVERALWDKRPGEKVALQVVRRGEQMTIMLVLLPASELGQAAASGESLGRPAAPATVGTASATNHRE